MVAKLAIYVCPVPGCATIASKPGACPKHENRALVREVYEHQPKPGAPKPGDLGGKTSSFDINDLIGGLFGGKGS